MPTVHMNVRIDPAIKDALDRCCRAQGVARNRFIEEAIVDRLEELGDIRDVKGSRREPARPLDEVLADLAREGRT